MFTKIQVDAILDLLYSKVGEIDRSTLAAFDKAIIKAFYTEILDKITNATDVEIFLDRKQRKQRKPPKREPMPPIPTTTPTPVPAEPTFIPPETGLNQQQVVAVTQLDERLATVRGRTAERDFYHPIVTVLTCERALTLQQIVEQLQKFRKLNELPPRLLTSYTDGKLRILLKWGIVIRRTNEFKQWEYLLPEALPR